MSPSRAGKKRPARKPATALAPVPKPSPAPPQSVATVLASGERSLLDVVDNLLGQGVVLSGDAMLGVAGVDLVYLRLSVILAAADRIFPRLSGDAPPVSRPVAVPGERRLFPDKVRR